MNIFFIIVMLVSTVSNLYNTDINFVDEESSVIIDNEASYSKEYNKLTIEEFKNIATKNGYYFYDDEFYENYPKEEYGFSKEVSDLIFGFALDEDGALQYRIEFYEIDSMDLLEEYYESAILQFKEWNDEEKTINEEVGENYKKCEIINKYGYGIVINVENTLFIAYGYEDELRNLVNEVYK